MHAGQSASRRDVILKTGSTLAASLLLSSSIATGAAHALFEKVILEGCPQTLYRYAQPHA